MRIIDPMPDVHALARGARFGPRIHPVTHLPDFHAGVDLAAAVGTPVYSPATGRLVAADTPAGGVAAKVIADDGVQYYFAHLARRTPDGHVAAGDVIGETGTTGRVTGPHLHFGIKRGGRWIDPVPVLQGLSPQILSGDVIYPIGAILAVIAGGWMVQ